MNTLAQRKAALKARIDAITETELLEVVEDVLAEKAAPELSPEQLADFRERIKNYSKDESKPLSLFLAETRASYIAVDEAES